MGDLIYFTLATIIWGVLYYYTIEFLKNFEKYFCNRYKFLCEDIDREFKDIDEGDEEFIIFCAIMASFPLILWMLFLGGYVIYPDFFQKVIEYNSIPIPLTLLWIFALFAFCSLIVKKIIPVVLVFFATIAFLSYFYFTIGVWLAPLLKVFFQIEFEIHGV